MKLEQFAMERMQSTYENLVEFNLSESGVRPLTARELIGDAAGLDGLLDQPLVYSQSNGTIELRQAIASMYPGAGIEHIEVTNGGSEANFITTFNLIEKGDEVVMLVPNYMQTWGLSRAFGGTIREWRLIEDHDAGRWRVDISALEALVTPRTKMIVICNPNNPTGARLTAADLDAIARIADKHGAWILSDEVYRGAEIDGVETASMWGRSPKAHRHQRIVESLRIARPAHRLDRRSAVADRLVLVVPRLRDDRTRRAERSPRAHRDAARAPRPVVRAHARHPAPQPAVDRSVADRRGRLPLDQAGSGRDRLCALRPSDRFV